MFYKLTVSKNIYYCELRMIWDNMIIVTSLLFGYSVVYVENRFRLTVVT